MAERPLIIAHRGYSGIAPENTLAALALGIRAGAHYLEIDVHTSADGVPVVIHDYVLERTTDGIGRVADRTAAQLAGLDAGSWFPHDGEGPHPYAGEPVPTLGQVLDLIAKEPTVNLLLEVKPFAAREQTARIVDEIAERDLAGRVLLQSYDEHVLADARDLAPAALDLGLLRDRFDDDPVAAARDLGCAAYNPNVDALLAEPDRAATLLGAGLLVMVHTADRESSWRALTDLAVTGIITNRPAELLAWQQTA